MTWHIIGNMRINHISFVNIISKCYCVILQTVNRQWNFKVAVMAYRNPRKKYRRTHAIFTLRFLFKIFIQKWSSETTLFSLRGTRNLSLRVMKRKQMMSEKVEKITKENRHVTVLFVSPDTRDDQALSIAKLAENENKDVPEKIKNCR